MVFLADVAAGRDNNFNLIRAIAATAVLVSHAYPIALGAGAAEPLDHLIGHSLGAVAVFIFFVISGFLIATSFERSSSRTSFLVARGLRLFPGLFVNLLLVVLVLGPIVTTLSPGAYFSDPATWSFLPLNMTLVKLQFTLPGVFTDVPYPGVVGSIWTLFHEVACYGGVFLLGVLGLLQRRWSATLALLVYFLAWLAEAYLNFLSVYHLQKLHDLSLPFVLGVAFHVWRDKLPLHPLGLAGTAGLALAAYRLDAGVLTYPALILAIGYWTFWLAYIPGGVIRRFNALGDYSYGIYLYAFPLQGFVVWLFGPQTPVENMLYAFPLTLGLSILSWHALERPALNAKGWVVTRLKRARHRPA